LHQKQNNYSGFIYCAMHTSWGWVGILSSVYGIRRLTLPRETRGLALSELGDLSNKKLDQDSFSNLEKKLQAYFSGEIVIFNEVTDLAEYPLFTKSVWHNTRQIGYGQSASYRDIAIKMGSPKSFRAVGQALKRNPVPIIIPCHRIIGNNGSIGGFNGGTTLKEDLLKLEKDALVKAKS